MEKLINKKKIDLACGQNRQPGFFGIDKEMIKGKVDAAIDLNIYPWPIKTGSVEEIFCAHYIEHIPHSTFEQYTMKAIAASESWSDFRAKMAEYIAQDGLIKFFNELHRIMKKGATVKFITPYYTSIRCWQDPTHTRAMGEASLLYFNKEWRTQNGLDHYGIDSDFDYSFGHDFMPEWVNKVQEARDFGLRHYNNTVADIHLVATKR